MSTLFYNWPNVEIEAKGNPFKIVDLLVMLYNDKILNPRLLKRLKGNSFLLMPEEILYNKTVDILYTQQYLLLAPQRNYAFYTLYGTKSLPLEYYPELNVHSLKTNPLLKVTNKEILFKFEELKK